MRTFGKVVGIGLLVIVAAFFIGAKLFPEKFNRPPAYTVRTVPSGRSYKIMASGPLYYESGRKKGLSIQYLADSLDDPEKLAEESNELMTLADRDAEAGNYDGIVIMAYMPVKHSGFFTEGKLVNTVFSRAPDGDWEDIHSSAPVSGELLAFSSVTVPGTVFAGIYSRVDSILKSKDTRALAAIEAPNYWHRLSNGRALTRDQDFELQNKALASLESIESATSTVTDVIGRGNLAVVLVKQSFVVVARGPNGEPQRLVHDQFTRDTWIKSVDDWKVAVSEDIKETTRPLVITQ